MKIIYCVETNKEYETIAEAAKELGVHASHIDMYLRGKTNTVKGYHFFVSKRRKVRCWETGEVYDDVVSAAKSIGRDRNALYGCLRGETYTCGGFRWYYIDTECPEETRAELWKKIDEHPSYSVSNAGRIRNDETNYILSGTLNEKGYVCVLLDGNRCKLHRLIAKAFIPNLDNKPQVNHKNGVKRDNQVDNLEWVTGEENREHAVEVLGVDARPRKYVCFDNGKVYHSKGELARAVGVKEKSINTGKNEWFVLKGLNYQEII